MTTELTKPLRRAIQIGDDPYVVAIDEVGLKLVAKGRRKGIELAWKDLVSGDAALTTALNATLGSLRDDNRKAPSAKKSSKSARATSA